MATKVIRVEKEVPEVYVNLSRDFQLLCRLFDVVFNGVKYNIDRAKYLSNPRYCAECYLNLLANKYGFEFSSDIYSDELRVILDSFKQIVMYKGSRKGICEAVNCFSYLKKKKFKYDIKLEEDGDIQIIIHGERFDTSILSDILKYVIPTGCNVNYIFSLAELVVGDIDDNKYPYGEIIKANIINVTNNSIMDGKIYENNTEYSEQIITTPEELKLIHNVNLTQVPSADQIDETKSTAIIIEEKEGN